MMRKDQEVGMDKNTEPNEGRELARRVAREWVRDEALVPLSIFSLDHPEPLAGWGALLQARGIELLTDDLYRPAIRREDARQLAEERREWERESAEKANRLQEEFEAPAVFGGVPALENGSAMESLMAHDPGYQTPQAEFGQWPKPRFLAEELEAGQRELAAERAAIAERKLKRDETR